MKTTYTWKLAPSRIGSGDTRSKSQLINNLKYGLGLKDAFFSSESLWMTLTVTEKIYKTQKIKHKIIAANDAWIYINQI